jgi:hypothetical protein
MAEALGCVTVKSVLLVPVPPEFVTLIGPVVAPAGTAVEICVPEFTVKTAAVPLNATADVPVNPVPVIVTAVPTAPLVGLNEVIEGGAGGGDPVSTTKFVALVAVLAAFVTLIFPVLAPLGTLVVI